MSGFQGDLCIKEIGEKDGRAVYELLEPLIYVDRKGLAIIVPKGFQTDFASVPRLPFIFALWGDRAHKASVLHDYLYRINSDPVVARSVADGYFRDAIISTGAHRITIAIPMWLGVRLGGFWAYHSKFVEDSLI